MGTSSVLECRCSVVLFVFCLQKFQFVIFIIPERNNFLERSEKNILSVSNFLSEAKIAIKRSRSKIYFDYTECEQFLERSEKKCNSIN